jgi:hypothetical protein
MDVLTHALSGILIASMLPSSSPQEQMLIIAGTVIPDLPFSQAYFIIAKKAKKVLWKLRLNDFTKFGPQVKPKLYTYLFFHSFFFLIPLFFIEWAVTNHIYLSLGWSGHLLYDLPSHKYQEKELRPKPLYPLSVSWNLGLTNGWKISAKTFLFIWCLHLLVILLLKNFMG